MSDQIDVNAIADVLNNKMDLDMGNLPASIDYVVQSKFPTDNDPSWYRLYRSGWVEQGGQASNTSVSFAIEMANTNYSVSMTYKKLTTSSAYGYDHLASLSTTGFVISGTDFTSGVGGYWEVKGMSAQGGN